MEVLREQDFGFYEGKSFIERPKEGNKSGKAAHQEVHQNDPGFKDVESKESMKARSDTFIDTHLTPLLHVVSEEHTVAIVAHGIILSHLWRAILKRFHPSKVSVGQGIQPAGNGFGLEHLGGWSNTGYLDLEVKQEAKVVPSTVMESQSASKSEISEGMSQLPQKPSTPPPAVPETPNRTPQLLDMSLLVKAVNSKEHLVGLKKTRGGIGSLEHDTKQKTVDSFFKKRRIE